MSGRVARSGRLAALGLLAAVLVGCRSGGDLVANPHLIIPPAEFVANATPIVNGAARELNKVPLPVLYVQPGDSLLLEPTAAGAVPLVTTDQVVAIDGTIDLGVYGRLQVAGLTVEEIEQRVRGAICSLDPDACRPPEDLPDDPEEAAIVIERARRGPVSVRVINPDSAVFYVLGEVAAPGSYPLVGRETVLDAILKAGGLSDRANRCDIILARPTGPGECRVVMRVCYDRLVQLGDATTNYQMLPGDRVYVASKTFCQSMQGICCFWKKGCEHCCDTGSCPCPSPEVASPLRRPFVLTGGFPGGPTLVAPRAITPLELPPADGPEADRADDTAGGRADDAGNDQTARGDAKRAAGGDGRRPEGTTMKRPAGTTIDLSPPASEPQVDVDRPADRPQVTLPSLD